jgi:hypothetical protein
VIRSYYSDSIQNFLKEPEDSIVGKLTINNEFNLEQTQRDAWLEEIKVLKSTLKPFKGTIYFEYLIPRMGSRIDALLLIGPVVFVLEFKIFEHIYHKQAIDQVWDYGLDLKNFHETSHEKFVAPILIATGADDSDGITQIAFELPNDKLFVPIKATSKNLSVIIQNILDFVDGENIVAATWDEGRYSPTPTIIEAALALYGGHSVVDISRSDAGAINIEKTSNTISEIIKNSKSQNQKSICFVTGVPGSGKTLVGLNIATKHIDNNSDLYSVFLSGNGPLVAILREALTRNKVSREKKKGNRVKKKSAYSEVKTFIQNVHNFRDEGLVDELNPPREHVAIFDEAQRAWNVQQTSNFMKRKKNRPNFDKSEPEFLISCMDRHRDWAVVVCLVGGGQEINTGEAGISEWFESIKRSYPDWKIYISPKLSDSEYGTPELIKQYMSQSNTKMKEDLHLSVSMRSFRAENLAELIKEILDLDIEKAKKSLIGLKEKYPIVITRDLGKAKVWLRSKARGTERYGIVVSSQAERLKPHAIDVKTPVDPLHWFLDDKDDVRSSYYLEDVATEFHIQGLELDWACVTWDADFRYTPNGWENWSFRGSKWQHIHSDERQKYLKNAYRVLLTRARQGMVIVVPPGDVNDPTRKPEYYDKTFKYLKDIGFELIN